MDVSAENYRKFLSGDTESFTQIVSTYADGLILYINTFVKDLHIAEELTEETFVKLVIKKPHLQKDQAFKTWLYTIAGNLARDYLRKRKIRTISLEDCEEQSEWETLEQRYIFREGNELLYKAMGLLKPEYKQILWLLYFEGFSCREAASVLHKTLHNTQVLASRARKALKDKMLEEGYTYETL